jgi:hypothetical protein
MRLLFIATCMKRHSNPALSDLSVLGLEHSMLLNFKKEFKPQVLLCVPVPFGRYMAYNFCTTAMHTFRVLKH